MIRHIPSATYTRVDPQQYFAVTLTAHVRMPLSEIPIHLRQIADSIEQYPPAELPIRRRGSGDGISYDWRIG